MIHPDYDCSTVVTECLGETIWQHRVISKDRLKAITIAYSTTHKRTSPPVYHFHVPDADKSEGYDDCDVVQAPCSAEVDLLIDIFDVGTIGKLHSGETDPGVKFWRMMISRLASYVRDPVKYDYQDDREESSCTDLPLIELCDGSDQAVGTQQGRPEDDDESSGNGVCDETGPTGRDGGHREAPSGTIRSRLH